MTDEMLGKGLEAKRIATILTATANAKDAADVRSRAFGAVIGKIGGNLPPQPPQSAQEYAGWIDGIRSIALDGLPQSYVDELMRNAPEAVAIGVYRAHEKVYVGINDARTNMLKLDLQKSEISKASILRENAEMVRENLQDKLVHAQAKGASDLAQIHNARSQQQTRYLVAMYKRAAGKP